MQSKLARKFFGAFTLAALMVNAAQAAAPTAPQGVITAKEFLGIGGVAVADLTNNAKFPNSPDVIAYPSLLEWPTSNDPATPPAGDVKNDYGVQIQGYYYPERTGLHTFWLSADDGAGLWLSTDDNPANKVKIANEPTWNGVRAWTATTRRAVVDQNTQRTENISAPINLVAGRAYYIEALMKEGGGGDNLSVAVTSSFDEQPVEPILGSRLSSFGKASGPVTITTAPPATLTVNEGAPLNLVAVVDGTPPYDYQWLRNGQPVDGATNSSLLIARAPGSDNNAVYSLRVSNNGGANTVTSAGTTVTVVTDNTPPTIASVTASSTLDSFTVRFSEPVDPTTALTAANYTVAGLAVTGVSAAGDSAVTVRTARQTAGQTYTLTIRNVRDQAATPNVIAANTTATAQAWVLAPGFVFWEAYHGIGGTAVADLTNNVKFPGAPDASGYIVGVDTVNGYGENYGMRVSGFITPPTSGDYHFFIRSDDASALWISSTDSPSGFRDDDGDGLPDPVAYETGCCGAFEEPDLGFTETTIVPLTMTAGQRYYFEAIVKEGGGGDFLQVAARNVNDSTAASALQPLRGTWVSTYANPNNTITVTTPPTAQSTIEGFGATFSVNASVTSGPLGIQWLRNGQPIAGATRSTLELVNLSLADNNAQFSAQLSAPGATSVTTPAVPLTVVVDTVPPKVLSGGALKQGNAWQITLLIDEKLGNVNLAAEASVSIPGVTVTGATYVTNVSGLTSPQSGVVLSTSTALTPGQSYAVTYNGLKDRKNNTQTTAATVNITASPLSWASIGRDNDWSDPAVISVATNGFNLVSGGQSFWASDDDVTFVYEEITGNFDKVARVVYQDPSSQWARAGLTAREALNVGEYPREEASRYQNAHVNPSIMYTGGVANNGYEGNRRTMVGGATDGAGGSGGTTYPNSWVRLKREGNVLSIWRSADNVTWTQYGSTDFSAVGDLAPLSDKMYVGMVYGPEAGNVPEDSGLRASWAAVIRDYGNFQAPVANGPISVTLAGANITLSWTGTGTLEASDSLSTPNWAPVAGVTGTSHTTAASAARRFYRIRR